MTMIPVDEAAAFDTLSIMEIKASKGLCDADTLKHFTYALCRQMNIQGVIDSAEYAELQKANEAVWSIQEQAMRDTCKASDIDKANQQRYKAKAALQKRWFSTPLTEQKSPRPYEQPQHKEGAD